MEELKKENQALKEKIRLYEISTKRDYEKIEKLKDIIQNLTIRATILQNQ